MRGFDTYTKALLRAPSIHVRILMTFYLDQGTYRFCDDFVDVTDGTNVWIGAGAFGSQIDIKSGRDLAAEPVTVTLDGNKMTQAGIKDPARVLSDIMGYLTTQRRVDLAFGFSYADTFAIQAIIPCAALKINNCRLVDQRLDWLSPGKGVDSKLEIVLDSLAMRYGRTTYRTRSQADQQEIDSTDMFFAFTADAVNTERTLYWGKGASSGTSTPAGISGGTAGGDIGLAGRSAVRFS